MGKGPKGGGAKKGEKGGGKRQQGQVKAKHGKAERTGQNGVDYMPYAWRCEVPGCEKRQDKLTGSHCWSCGAAKRSQALLAEDSSVAQRLRTFFATSFYLSAQCSLSGAPTSLSTPSPAVDGPGPEIRGPAPSTARPPTL